MQGYKPPATRRNVLRTGLDKVVAMFLIDYIIWSVGVRDGVWTFYLKPNVKC